MTETVTLFATSGSRSRLNGQANANWATGLAAARNAATGIASGSDSSYLGTSRMGSCCTLEEYCQRHILVFDAADAPQLATSSILRVQFRFTPHFLNGFTLSNPATSLVMAGGFAYSGDGGEFAQILSQTAANGIAMGATNDSSVGTPRLGANDVPLAWFNRGGVMEFGLANSADLAQTALTQPAGGQSSGTQFAIRSYAYATVDHRPQLIVSYTRSNMLMVF